MRSVLTALQEGRLFELPDTGKPRSLTFLARILDANPNIEVGTDAIEEIQVREQECNTGIGLGVAVPHVRARRDEGELFCAIGWSAQGIDYGAQDGALVHLVFMYYIPGAQKNVYLKEISTLIKAVRKSGGMEPIAHAPDLNAVRNLLLDWVSIVAGESGPEAVARMIKLDLKQAQAPSVLPAASGAAVTPAPAAPAPVVPLPPAAQVATFSVLIVPPATALVLAHDAVWSTAMEKEGNLGPRLAAGTPFTVAGRQIFVTGASRYEGDRTLYYCVAVVTAV
jgi:mannitol/fructose-specific phosphotransferase system IIA component (Ntr-type)